MISLYQMGTIDTIGIIASVIEFIGYPVIHKDEGDPMS